MAVFPRFTQTNLHICTKWCSTSEIGQQLCSEDVKETSAEPVLLEYDTMPVGSQILTFWGNIMYSFKGWYVLHLKTYQPFKMRTLLCFPEMWGSDCLLIQHRISWEQNLQLQHCEDCSTQNRCSKLHYFINILLVFLPE